jgi:MFS transporter, MHS family, alpha-ketoglutarate permease
VAAQLPGDVGICVALFGGTAPYLQQWLGTTLDMPDLFNVYAVLLLVVGAAFVFTIPETKGKDLTH